jgi:uncharacterized protein YndB with AHSA1/START domain
MMCAMKFDHEMHYAASPTEVYAMLADPKFRDKVAEAGGAFEREVVIDAEGRGMSVLVDQKQRDRNLPSIAKKIVGDTIHVVQRERWTDEANASLEVAIPGKPGHLAGTITLSPDGEGTLERVAAEIKVHVPLVAGKLERLIADLLESALRTEQSVGEAWLRGQR